MDKDGIEALYRRLVGERCRLIGVAAESAVLPPSGFLTRTAVLDGSISATEAVLDELSAGRKLAAE